MRRAVAALLRLAAVGCLSALTCTLVRAQPAGTGPARSAAELMDVVMWNREPIGGGFELTDHLGRPRRDSDYRGQLLLMYFGFTTCPDICPTDLLEIGQALNRLGPAAAQVTPLFITLDPGRDTRTVLSGYVPSFHPRLVGLTGTTEAVHRVADAYKVYHAKVPVPGALGYTIDHSAYVYIVDRDGRYLGFLPPGTPAERIAQALRPHLKPQPR